ncbi:hypothetical protein GCM10010978_28090 [Compostibacillus humi]|uniref:Uncharacterized protein n=1 Tax=Compostibacillus humi TaxID=1245525 RepID=A0A8J2TSH6_9BACI|nr:hypothetical protein [Compostibacillus humi]GFZ86551.1 hypothetical protein GCM10010978_28090 [Compostibacillus humi]
MKVCKRQLRLVLLLLVLSGMMILGACANASGEKADAVDAVVEAGDAGDAAGGEGDTERKAGEGGRDEGKTSGKDGDSGSGAAADDKRASDEADAGSGDTASGGKAAASGNDASAVNPGEGAVVTINEKTFDKDDVEFFTLMEKIRIEAGRHLDQKQFDGEEWEGRNAYWEEQLEYFENMNVQLQNVVEIYAMSLLAEEKHYFNPQEKLEKEMEAYVKKIRDIPAAKELIEAYGEDEFNYRLQEYMDYSLLRDRVVSDLIDDIKEENPDITDAELNYELSKSYEDLYIDHINDIEITIHIQ